MTLLADMNDLMDEETCYAWGELFASPWDALVEGMVERARTMGLDQTTSTDTITWMRSNEPTARFVFVDDPTNIDKVRAVFNDNANLTVPACFIVVRQNDPSEDRGDVVFDIFRLSPQSYLWHFYRVYTRPKSAS